MKMPDKNEKIISALNDLIETCKDAEKGFREASESVRSGYHQVMLSDLSRQRGQYASRLQARVRTLGGDPEKKGSFVGMIHRGWMNLKAVLATGDRSAIISECERGEEAAFKNYQTALAIDMPEDLRNVLNEQLDDIKDTLRRLKGMKN